VKLVLSIDDVEFNNNMVDDDDGFEFPIVFTTKKMNALRVLSDRENAMRYLSEVMSHSNRSDPAISVVLVVNKSSDSAAGKIT